MTTDTALIQKMDDDLETLLPCEVEQLEKCEETIEQGLGTFLDVGRALADIRDNRLYKATHRTFERYCKDRWDLSRPRAYQQIYGYEAVALLESKMSTIVDKKSETTKPSPIGDIDENDDLVNICRSCEYKKGMSNPIHGVKIPGEANGKCTRPGGLCEIYSGSSSTPDTPKQEILLPRNEAQARPLSKLTPDQQVEAWALVLEWVNDGAKLTSYLVGKAAKQVTTQAGNEVLQRERKKAEQPSTLVSRLFQKRLQDLMDVIAEEYNTGWRTTSKKEVLRRLSAMVRAVDELV